MRPLKPLSAIILLLLATSCATAPVSETVLPHVEPQTDPTRFAGNFRNLRVGFDPSTKVIGPDDSLFHTLALRYFSPFGDDLNPIPSRDAVTSIEHVEGTRFRVSLFEGDRLVETIPLELSPADGYLVSGRKLRAYPLIVVNGFQSEVFAIGLDADNRLHAFKNFHAMAGFLFVMGGNRDESHSVFQRIPSS